MDDLTQSQIEARREQKVASWEIEGMMTTIMNLRKSISEKMKCLQDKEQVVADPAWRVSLKIKEVDDRLNFYKNTCESAKNEIKDVYATQFKKMKDKHALDLRTIEERYKARMEIDLKIATDRYNTLLKQVEDKMTLALDHKESEYIHYIAKKEIEKKCLETKRDAVIENRPKKLKDVKEARELREAIESLNRSIDYYNQTYVKQSENMIPSSWKFAVPIITRSRSSSIVSSVSSEASLQLTLPPPPPLPQEKKMIKPRLAPKMGSRVAPIIDEADVLTEHLNLVKESELSQEEEMRLLRHKINGGSYSEGDCAILMKRLMSLEHPKEQFTY